MFKKILLASDGSEHSFRAAQHAIQLARCSFDAFIEVLYVVDSSNSKSDVLRNWNKADVSTERKEKIESITEVARKAGISYQIKISRGEPGPVIVDYANKNDFDVVVVGSRGLNTVQEMVLGSVSHNVAKRVNCPVLLVK